MVCPVCKKPYKPSPEELKQLFGPLDQKKDVQLYQGPGCSDCDHTGYHGRKAVYEILCVSREMRKMIVGGESDDAIKQQAIKEGMKTLYKSAVDEIISGATALDELMRVVDVGAQ